MRSTHRSLVFLVVCAALFLTACSGGQQQVAARPLYSGSDGIILSFPESNSLKQYQGNTFTVAVRLLNDGAADVNSTDPGFLTASFDPSVISPVSVSVSSGVQGVVQPKNSFDTTTSDAANVVESAASAFSTGLGSQLGTRVPAASYIRAAFGARGRSILMPVGDVAYVEYTFRALNLSQNRQTATTPLMIQACYPYTTTFIANVCVDRGIYANANPQACTAATITAQPQGAPIAVTTVVPRYTRLSDSVVEARYEITFQNLRGGLIVNRTADSKSIQSCSLDNLQRANYGVAIVSAAISGTPLKCGYGTDDGVVRFQKDTATITCRLDAASAPQGFANGANYAAPLILQLRYFYIQSLPAQLEVNR